MDIRSIREAKLAAVGPGTRKEIKERGLCCDLVPEIYDGEHLGILLGEHAKSSERILIARAEQGSRQLVEEIAKRTEARITDLPIYKTVYETHPFETGSFDMAVFTSASTVKGFVQSVKHLDMKQVQAVCIGQQTERAAKEQGMQTITAQQATIDSLVGCCIQCREKEEK